MLPEIDTPDGFAAVPLPTVTAKALAAGVPPAAVSSAWSNTIASELPSTVALETAGAGGAVRPTETVAPVASCAAVRVHIAVLPPLASVASSTS